MKLSLRNAKKNIYRIELTDEEARHRVFECLRTTNPELSESDLKRDMKSKSYVASYRRSDGEMVRISVGISNLKRYFGAFVLGFTEDGIAMERPLRGKFA